MTEVLLSDYKTKILSAHEKYIRGWEKGEEVCSFLKFNEMPLENLRTVLPPEVYKKGIAFHILEEDQDERFIEAFIKCVSIHIGVAIVRLYRGDDIPSEMTEIPDHLNIPDTTEKPQHFEAFLIKPYLQTDFVEENPKHEDHSEDYCWGTLVGYLCPACGSPEGILLDELTTSRMTDCDAGECITCGCVVLASPEKSSLFETKKVTFSW